MYHGLFKGGKKIRKPGSWSLNEGGIDGTRMRHQVTEGLVAKSRILLRLLRTMGRQWWFQSTVVM